MVGFPSCASKFEWKNKLKCQAIISSFFVFVSNFSNRTNMLFNTSIYSFSVLELYKLIKMYSESLTETLRIKMQPSLSVSCFLTKNVSFPK